MNKDVKEIIIPKGWEIDKIEDNKIILKESKKELPKTWEGCYKQLGHGEYISSACDIYKDKFEDPNECNHNALPTGLGKPMLALCQPMLALCQLLVYREIYRQGWKPDWDDDTAKYCIIITYNAPTKYIGHNYNRTLSFQSEEVRDEFLENFEDLIEEAKELI